MQTLQFAGTKITDGFFFANLLQTNYNNAFQWNHQWKFFSMKSALKFFWMKSALKIFSKSIYKLGLQGLRSCVFEGGVVVPSKARPKADPGSNGGPKARSCDLGAKWTGIETAKVKKKFWGPRRTTHGRSKMTRSHMGTPPNFSFFVFKILSNFLH